MTCLVLPNAFCRGRHASKVTEEEEDAEYLKEEEDGLSGSGSTRLVAQPSCKMIFPHFVKCLVILWLIAGPCRQFQSWSQFGVEYNVIVLDIHMVF